jgi:monoamine oxidase
MIDTAIVGGGLCGLALARRLVDRGRAVALFEARDRLGGRILSGTPDRAGMRPDLGPSWFWPDTQPRITRLVADLGLRDFPQHDEGAVLRLRDPDKRPEAVTQDPVHGGARRISGGSIALIETLGAGLSEHIRLGHVLESVTDLGDHVALVFRQGAARVTVLARHVVLAMPPRLVAEQVRFEPALGEAVVDALRGTGTWMAGRAKAVVHYGSPAWRMAGNSGNAFVSHDQAVLDEIFDACDEVAASAALGGFVALSPDQRQSFAAGLPLLIGNQIGQVFGHDLDEGALSYQDWAEEQFTCSKLDRQAWQNGHSGLSNPLLRRDFWAGRLLFGGSETAAHGAGYLEGALESADRVARALEPEAAAIAGADRLSLNATSVATFRAWVAVQGEPAFDAYRQRLNRGLAQQQKDQLTQVAVLGALEEVLDRALAVIADLPFDAAGVTVERGRCGLTPDIQAPFGDLMRRLFDDVMAFNATSCALSNFPDEHRLSREYRGTILRDMAAAWQEFSLTANRALLEKIGASIRISSNSQ